VGSQPHVGRGAYRAQHVVMARCAALSIQCPLIEVRSDFSCCKAADAWAQTELRGEKNDALPSASDVVFTPGLSLDSHRLIPIAPLR
jgi:hypothetical protein